MKETNENSKKIEQPGLQWDQAGRLVSDRFGDIYFDRTDGLAESRYTFVDGNDLHNRFSNLKTNESFVMAETGFGTGLNFLATWALWQKSSQAGELIYHGIEKFPIDPQKLKEILSHWKELQTQTNLFIEKYQLTDQSVYCWSWPEQRITLHLYIDDVNTLAPRLDFQADAWFLDGFAPACNPDMWTETLFENIARCTKPNGTLATFTAAGQVKKALRNVGFKIKRRPGFGKKWHMLQGWKS